MPLRSGGAVDNEFLRGRSNSGLISIEKTVVGPPPPPPPPTLPNILDLSFPAGDSAVSGDVDVTYWSGFGRKCFYANGRWWVFYSDGTNIVYRSCADGKTWSSPTTIRACDSSHNFSVWFDGTYLHYAATATNDYNVPIVYRCGTPNANGSITWLESEQTVRQDANMAFRNIIIAVDSDGYPWIGMMVGDYTSPPGGNGIYADVTKSSMKWGIWSTASGFPYRPDGVKNKRDLMILVPLTGMMYIIYVWSGYVASNPINGRLWNGLSWGAQETATSRQSMYGDLTAVAYGDIVHIVYVEKDTNDIYHLKRQDSSWSEMFIMAGTVDVSVSLSVQTETGYLWLFYIKTYDIFYRKYTTTWSASDILLQDRAVAQSPYSINSYYQVNGDKLGVVWTESPSYTVAHSGLYGS